MDQHIL